MSLSVLCMFPGVLSTNSPLLFIDSDILYQKLFTVRMWKVRSCYPLFISLWCYLLPLAVFMSSHGPLLTSFTLPTQENDDETAKPPRRRMHKQKWRVVLGCRKREAREWEPSVFFMHFYPIYVHPQGTLCLCLCLPLCIILFVVIIQCIFLPHPSSPPTTITY